MLLDRAFPVDRQIVSILEVLNRDGRLDPSRYNQRGEKMLRHLRGLDLNLAKVCDLPEFVEVYLPNRFTRIYLTSSAYGVPMLGTSTMLMLRLPLDARIRIDDDLEHSPLRILPGDILISRSGTVGTTILCGDSYSSHVASDDCFRLRVAEAMRGFVTAYLQSPFGRTLLTRSAHGKVIKHLKERDVRNLRIPMIPPESIEHINDLILRESGLLDNARDSLERTEAQLNDALSNAEAEASQSHAGFVQSSTSLFRIRLDPHFYTPDAKGLRDSLSSRPHKKLGEIADTWMPTRFARSRAAKGYGVPFYSSADIMRAERIPSATLSHRSGKYIKKCVVEAGTVLICRSGALGGIMGRTMLASPAMNGWAISEHMVRCKVTDSDFPSEYVFGFLGSRRYGYPIITSYRHGKDVPELSPDELKTIPVPVLTPGERESIAREIRDAFQKVDEANVLRDEAQRELLRALRWEE